MGDNPLRVCQQALRQLVLTISLSGIVGAQATAEELSRCSSLQTIPSKLGCYEGLARRSTTNASVDGPTAAAPGARVLQNWRATDQVDPISDAKGGVFSLPAQPTERTAGAQLVVRCVRGLLDLYVLPGKYLGFGNDRITLRLDGDSARVGRWNPSSDHMALFRPGGRARILESLQEMALHRRLSVQVTPYNEIPLALVFELAGVDDVLKEVTQLCPDERK